MFQKYIILKSTILIFENFVHMKILKIYFPMQNGLILLNLL